MQTAVFHSTLHIHQEIVYVHQSFRFFSRPKPGGGVYHWGPYIILCTNRFVNISPLPSLGCAFRGDHPRRAQGAHGVWFVASVCTAVCGQGDRN